MHGLKNSTVSAKHPTQQQSNIGFHNAFNPSSQMTASSKSQQGLSKDSFIIKPHIRTYSQVTTCDSKHKHSRGFIQNHSPQPHAAAVATADGGAFATQAAPEA
jgi:hypothetical protein